MQLLDKTEWRLAQVFANENPEVVKQWSTIRTKSSQNRKSNSSRTKRIPLHHACLKLRSETKSKADAADAILTLVEIYPDGARQRENRHGCLPLHL